MSSRPSRFATHVASLLAVLVAVSACKGRTGPQGGGQTGDGSEFDPTLPTAIADAALACELERSVVTDLAEDTELGFSPNDVLDFAVGEFTSTLRWTPPNERFMDAEVGPESGNGEITLRVSYDGGEVRYAAPVPPDETGTDPGDGTSAAIATDTAPSGGGCIEWLEIDVTVSVESTGGALDETFQTTLVATSATSASFSKTLRFADLGGALVVTPSDGSVTALAIDGIVSSYGTRGTLGATIGLPESGAGDDTAVSGGNVALASWPADSVCGGDLGPALVVPGDATWNGVPRADVASLLIVDGPTTVIWSDKSTTELSVAVDLGDDACLVDAGGRASVSYPAMLTLSTTDERLSGTFGVFLTPIIDNDTLVSLQALLGIGGKAAIERLGFSLAGHDDGYFNLDLSFGQELSGSVSLTGYDTSVCEDVPVADDGGGMSTGGCVGGEGETLLSGSWGTGSEAPAVGIRPEETREADAAEASK